MNSLPRSRFLRILMHFWVLLHMGMTFPCIFVLRFRCRAEVQLGSIAHQIFRRLLHRKSSFLELLVLPGFLSDPRQRGFGLTYFDRERNPQTLWQFFFTHHLTLSERLFFVGVLGLRWLTRYGLVIRILEKKRAEGGTAGALSSLYLADLCLFAMGWTEEFEIDRPIHSSETPGDMFGDWYNQLLGTNTKLSDSLDGYLRNAIPIQAKSPYYSYLLLLRSLRQGDWASAQKNLSEFEDHSGKLLPYTRSVLDLWLGKKTVAPGGVQLKFIDRQTASESPIVKVLVDLPALEIEMPVHEVDRGKVSKKIKRISFPRWSCARFSKGVIAGSFASDLVLENGTALKGSLIFNETNDPRRVLFSRSRASFSGDKEIYCLEEVDQKFRDAILLPSLSDNFFHFLFDTVGAFLLIPQSERLGKKVLIGAAESGLRGFHRDIISRVGMEDVTSFREVSGTLEVENGVWCQEPSWNTVPRPEVIHKLLTVMQPGETGDLIFAKRAIFFYRTGQRRLPKAYFSQLKKFCRLNEIEMHDPAGLSIAAQIALMRETRVLFVESGAAASNAIYLPEGAALVILVTRFAMKDCFITIPYVRKLHLIYVYSDNLDFFANPMRIWTEPLPGLDLESLERANDLAKELLAGRS